LEVDAIGFDAIRAQEEAPGNLRVRFESRAVKPPPPTSNPKHGKEDPDNKPHIGGNTWAGGTGGSDTAGLGGRGGPYRLDKGHKIHQVSEDEKRAVPKHIQEAARKMGQEALDKRLKEIKMSAYEASAYADMSDRIRADVQRLRVVLESLPSTQKERTWVRHRTQGELDDSKLVEGILGEPAIYKERQQPDATNPWNQESNPKPKRVKLVFDCSGSMYRFNSYDGRLTRSLETALMIIETLASPTLSSKFVYDIQAHSGDSACIPFIEAGKPPKDELERLKVLEGMVAHSQYCWSGDNTVLALETAVKQLGEEAKTKKEEADEYFVILVSDANLARYGIPTSAVAKALNSNPEVQAAVIFVGSLGVEAQRIVKDLPVGKAFVAMETTQVPRIMGALFAAMGR
jgi:hypothetical protein